MKKDLKSMAREERVCMRRVRNGCVTWGTRLYDVRDVPSWKGGCVKDGDLVHVSACDSIDQVTVERKFTAPLIQTTSFGQRLDAQTFATH